MTTKNELTQRPQFAPQHLAGRGHRQGIGELHVARIFMRRELHLDELWISRASASPGVKRTQYDPRLDRFVRIGSGIPTTADIATAGCFISVCSISDARRDNRLL